MDNKRAETLLYQIMSGHIEVQVEGKTLLVRSPTISQKRQAAEVYQQAYESTTYDIWMTDAQNKNLLVSMGYVSKEVDDNFKEISDRIDDLKVDLFDSMFNSEKRISIRTMLDKVKDKQTEMLMKRHQFDSMTRDGYAEIIKTQYLVAATLTHENGKSFYKSDSLAYASFSLLDRVIQQVNDLKLDETEMRFLARSDLWRGYWVVSKAQGHPFGTSTIALTDDQRLLCQLTRMYDSAFDHPECPDDEVIIDDDAFDGWMIKERRKGEKDRNQRMVDDLTQGKHESAHEMFIVAGSQKDAKKINSLNDPSSQVIKQQRQKAIDHHGTIHDAAMPDQQVRIRTEAAQLMAQTIKGNKGK